MRRYGCYDDGGIVGIVGIVVGISAILPNRVHLSVSGVIVVVVGMEMMTVVEERDKRRMKIIHHAYTQQRKLRLHRKRHVRLACHHHL